MNIFLRIVDFGIVCQPEHKEKLQIFFSLISNILTLLDSKPPRLSCQRETHTVLHVLSHVTSLGSRCKQSGDQRGEAAVTPYSQ